MIVHKCDICKKETDEKYLGTYTLPMYTTQYATNAKRIRVVSFGKNIGICNVEICNECANEIAHFINTMEPLD